ncbi:hypothetical protein GPECTOR_80g179 [Gonium pectorale]|uniref:UvrD-like helicase ATP-binding domain-containing protein n=1 Tax=Gonium pectorale TaxID=33097 RepID=A0A150G1R2_GONPE|nr:hypothetical protein GPECTOR_80g179 [Gonium pectorale]|eukprot:KXZ43819.1 hypothetical protein GPECTOR_80g179 [Gonium pectorale]
MFLFCGNTLDCKECRRWTAAPQLNTPANTASSAILPQLLAFAGGRFPARIDPFAAVRKPFREHLHVHLLWGGRLALLWGVRLHYQAAERRWVQALQAGRLRGLSTVWDVLSTRRNGPELHRWLRRIEAELETFTDEHLAALRMRQPPETEKVVMPLQWVGDLPFRRTRESRQLAAAAVPAAAAAATATTTGTAQHMAALPLKGARGGRTEGDVDDGAAASREGVAAALAVADGGGDDVVDGVNDNGSGDGGAGLGLDHTKYYMMDALYARLMCVAPQGFVIERMHEMAAEQQLLVQKTASIILIGRSGTGKTSVILSRMLAVEQALAVMEAGRGEAADGATADPEQQHGGDAIGAGEINETEHNEVARRQLLVTLSPKLAVATSKYLRNSMATFRAGLQRADSGDDGCGTGADPDAESGTASGDDGSADGDGGGNGSGKGLSALFDEDEVAYQFGPLPERLADVPTGACPLVLDLRRFLAMLDASLERPFAAAQRQRTLAAAGRTDAARGKAARGRDAGAAAAGAGLGAAADGGLAEGAVGGAEGHGIADHPEDDLSDDYEADDAAAAAADARREAETEAEAEAAPLMEVDYERFQDSYWQRHNTEHRIRDPALVWREVQTTIKGSLAALASPGGRLAREDYLALAGTRAGAELNEQTRARIYELFRRYEQEKGRRGEYDVADLTWHLHEQLAAGGGFPGAPFRFVYLDEVQDLTPAQIALFKYICPWPEDGLVLAGDTAQTIAKGVSFRFEALKDVFYNVFMSGQERPKVPEVTPLLQNFRTHAQICRLAHFGVLEPLLFFFPDALDKLPPETSEATGDKPLLLLPSCGAIETILSDGAASVAGADDSGDDGVASGSKAGAAVGPSEGDKAASPPSAAAGAGSEVVVLVPSEAAKAEARRRLSGSDVLVLTATESKGLEFKVVLLYNFFSASRLAPNKWRLLYRALAAWGRLPDGAVQPGGSHACPAFDAQAHSGMAPELKALYVAVTRGCTDVIVLESDPEACGPVRELWERMGLVEVRSKVDARVQERLLKKMTAEERRKRAHQMVTQGRYEDAARDFGILGDDEGRAFCEAQLARAAAKKACDHGQADAARQHHARAADLFIQCGKYLSAAKSFERAALWGEAGDVYHGHCQESLEAARCYEKARRWEDAAERLTEVEHPDEGILERAFIACRNAGKFMLGVQAMRRWQQSAARVAARSNPTAASTSAADKQRAAAAAAAAVGRRAAQLSRRLISLGAVHWKGRPYGQEEMMQFVRMMPGEERVWLSRYQLYDVLVQLDIADGRFLAAARTLERKGDADSLERAVDLYSDAGAPQLATELLFRRARAGALWGGKGGDWPPPSAGGATGRYLKEAEALLAECDASGGDTVLSPRLDPLAPRRLEAALLRTLLGSAAKAGGGGGGGQRPLERWEEWRTRLEGREAQAHGPVARMARLCLLRLLSSEAQDRMQQLLIKPGLGHHGRQQVPVKAAPTQAQQQRQQGRPQQGPNATGAADVQAVSSAALELLRLWGPYSRLLLEVLRVLGRLQVVTSSPRDALLLEGVQAYHVVRPASELALVGDVPTAAGRTSAAALIGNLELGCPPSAAWVGLVGQRLRLAPRDGAASGAGGTGGPAGGTQLLKVISAADFAAAAGLYWRAELEARSRVALGTLLDMAAQLEPDYERFKELGGLEIRDAGRSGGWRWGRAQASAACEAGVGATSLDATQLRVQLLVAAAAEARRLAQLAKDQAASAPGRQADKRLVADRTAALMTTMELLFGATAAVPLPAMVQMGSLPAARQAAAEALETYGREMLAAAAASGARDVRPLQDSRAGILWERPAHARLKYEEIARAAILQPLLQEGWLLRVEQEGVVDWQVPWMARPGGLAAWQVLLAAARVADAQRGLVPRGTESSQTHLLSSLAYHGLTALLDYHCGRSLTARPREWDPWVGMRPLTFLALLERYTILALCVTTGGLNGLVLPSSLVLDHMTQPGVADLVTYTMRHSRSVSQADLAALHRLLCRPQQPGLHYQPAGQAHAGGGVLQATPVRRLAFFRLPDWLLNAAGEDLAGDEQGDHGSGDEGEDDDDDVGGGGGNALLEAEAEAAPATEQAADGARSLAVGGAADGPGDDVAAAGLAAATANQLGRRCYTMTRLWLSRARQQLLLPALNPLQRERRAARAAVRSLAGVKLTDATRTYCTRLVDIACPLQVEVADMLRRLERTVQWLLGPGRATDGDEEAQRQLAQSLDLAFEYRERLQAGAAMLDIASRPELHRALDVGWLLQEVVAPLQQLVREMRGEKELVEAITAAGEEQAQEPQEEQE